MINNAKKLLNYFLIGIGEFSHGIYESWEFRFKLLKYTMKNTNKKKIDFKYKYKEITIIIKYANKIHRIK